MQATDVGSILGWKDPLEEDTATHSVALCLENPMDSGAWVGYHPRDHENLDTTEAT